MKMVKLPSNVRQAKSAETFWKTKIIITRTNET
jgi:hypothetical protein